MLIPLQGLAIVNMDGLHFNKVADKFSADVEFKISGNTGNNQSSNAALNGQFSWAGNSSINLIILGYQYGESNRIRTENKAFIHYRYIHQLSDLIDWEIFTQIEENEFTRLSYRGLIGLATRFSVLSSSHHKALIGTGVFHSTEKIDFRLGLTDDGVEDLSRGNFYFLSKYKVKPSLSISNVIY